MAEKTIEMINPRFPGQVARPLAKDEGDWLKAGWTRKDQPKT